MKKILITGATGNIGREVIRFLYSENTEHKIIAGVRDTEPAKTQLERYEGLQLVTFDFKDHSTFPSALENVDSVFLLRPPAISDVKKHFAPLFDQMKKSGVREVLFLSVQGVEKSSIIPHYKIESLLKESGISYIFLRPSYFMQNLTSNLLKDIKEKRKIILPAGKAEFLWVDGRDIGEAAARLLENFADYKDKAYEITGYEWYNFEEVANEISKQLEDTIEYKSVNPIRFYFIKKKEGMPSGMIMVMIVLHFLPRFQAKAEKSSFYEQLTGKKPTTLEEFVAREKESWKAH